MDTALDIIEYAAVNKISIETQFKRFINSGAKQGRPKKVKNTNPSIDEIIVDLVSTPPLPSPTHITQEYIPHQTTINPVDIYKNAMSEKLKERLHHDDEF